MVHSQSGEHTQGGPPWGPAHMSGDQNHDIRDSTILPQLNLEIIYEPL